MFPLGMVVKADTKQVLTDNINEVFSIMSYFTEKCKQIKSGQSMNNIDLSALVLGAGLEPARAQCPLDFKSNVSTNSTIRASSLG